MIAYSFTATIDATGLSGELRHLTLEPFAVRDWQGDAELAGSRVTLAREMLAAAAAITGAGSAEASARTTRIPASVL